ncbi:MAG: alpha-ketoacid dehydrogenase subunit beta, partial [Candidatus Diapherotrites archaeon]|nr:alpha-ketoacid dehydrogenase subunit beta [Candidatus Diapherotrites archaeon]
PEHHSESYEAMLANTPGLKVVIPSTPYDAKGLLISAIRDPDPVVFLEPKRIYRAIRGDVPAGPYTVPIGKANIIKEGNDVTIICYGSMVREVMKVADKHDKSIEVIDLRTISPLDTETFITSVKKTGRAVVVHEAPRSCGVGAEVSAQIMEKALLNLNAPVERVTGFDTIFPMFKNEDLYLPNEHRIKTAVDKVLNF